MTLPERVLFLDIDGVLNTPKYLGRHGVNGLDPYRVDHLDRIIDATGAGVVISSSWRHMTTDRAHSLDEIKSQLTSIGMMKNTIKVFDLTPQIIAWEDGWGSIDRGWEIDLWMRLRQFHGDYVILDDGLIWPLSMHQVRTDLKMGMTLENAKEAIAMFEKQAKARGPKKEEERP